MAPKKKGKTKSSSDDYNPADAILHHKAKQILADNHCSSLNDSDDDDDSDPMNLNDSSMDDACLHCQQHSLQVQVRCDECSAYICSHCHWCHEFQANHEIRVCDRCDAFYCRACDEMDQCDDCGEVVCGTCSTLLSCKFCGGGLCEDCATACGRCGIVLCSRDAKFAVDCDTCRLSYCLVCLASGNKDPCVRCGHRPSKRMEQLVHLRLKSIYKAFKSSTTGAAASSSTTATVSNTNYARGSSHHGPSSSHNNSTAASRKNNSQHHSSRLPIPSNNVRMRENDDPTADDLTPGALMLAAAASAAAPTSQLAVAAAAAASASINSQIAAAEAAAGLAVQAGCTYHNSSSVLDPRLTARATAESYEAERVKAEKAAAALLAELEEEEQAEKSKKSKKKKKKEKQQAKKQEGQQKKTDDEPEEEEEKKPPPRARLRPPSVSFPNSRDPHITNPGTKTDQQLHHHHAENITETTARTETTVASSKPEEKSEAQQQPVEVDPLEIDFESLCANEDVEGLERLLSSIKGVVGKAVLRKNIKKALKRFRVVVDEELEEDAAGEPVNDVSVPEMMMADATFAKGGITLISPATPPAPPVQLVSLHQQSTPKPSVPLNTNTGEDTAAAESSRVAELLAIVSQSHNKVSSNSRLPKGHSGTPKSECIMHMAPLIVGWVIGKGGQRIRDLMEESGARIWIDQDSMGPQEPRIVYVSGQRTNVDAAVRMITDLISKAPTDTQNSKPTSSPAIALDCHTNNNAASSLNFSKLPGLPMHMGMGETTAFQLKPREKKKNGDAKAWREMTCDARFVPLLIGKRGWTIKNIQDSSGARVDIDQNVTPRKITISGNEASVEIAARMVGDVLSYPQTLLHGGAADDLDIYPNGEPILEPPGGGVFFGGDPDQEESDPLERATSPIDVPSKSRSANSPPSSLIMTGDGKSTISATSSLSSTPEPSVSNHAAALAQMPPLLPPVFDQQHPLEMMNGPSFRFPLGPLLPRQNSLNGHQAYVGLGLGPDPRLSPHNTGFLHGNHPGMASAPFSGQLGGPPLSHLNFDLQPTATYTSGPHPNLSQNPITHHQHSGFPDLLQPQHRPINPPMQQHESSVLTGVWDSEPPSSRGGFGLEAAVDFLHHSQQAKTQSRAGQVMPQRVTGIGELMGLPNAPSASDPPGILGGLGLDHPSSEASLLSGTGKEDANIVASLFGSVSDPRNDAALVSGLRGLSLDPQPGSRSDLWGTSNSGFDLLPLNGDTPESVTLGQPLHHHGPNTVDGSSLFSTNMDGFDRRHSRFSWGESG